MTSTEAGALRIAYGACPLCEATKLLPLGDASCAEHPGWSRELPSTLHWRVCSRCGHVFTDGYWSELGLERVLASLHAHQAPGEDVESARKLAAPLVERVSLARGSCEGRWLDVGFGDGALLCTAEEFGYDVLGLDLRQECVRRMRAFGVRAQALELEALTEFESFDVISLCDVLEHLPFPRRALQHAAKLLAPRGHLLVSMPNMDSFAWKWLDQRGANPYWRELEHYHNFGRTRMVALLAECGFEFRHYAVSQRYRAGMELYATKR